MSFWKYIKLAMSESGFASTKRWLGTISLFVFMTLVIFNYDNESVRLLGYGGFALLGVSAIKYFRNNSSNSVGVEEVIDTRTKN